MICTNTYQLSRVAHAKGRNYAEIDGIRIVFENGKIEGWYNPGKPEDDDPTLNAPSEVDEA